MEAQFERNAGLLKNYNPRLDQVTIPTVMLLSQQTCDAAKLCGLKYAWLDDAQFRKRMTREWGRVVGGLFQTLEVEGNHFNMFEARHVSIDPPITSMWTVTNDISVGHSFAEAYNGLQGSDIA